MPDWSSVGAKPALALANGVADGLFSWAAWPWGNLTMDTYTDASYLQYLDDKPYMFALSPWFYTNLKGYDKNWLWQGDSLWFDRWQELLSLDSTPEFVEIISWNDYGESHYIGPLRDTSMAAFEIGEANYNYALGYPHDAWRDVLPFLIDLYKDGTATMGKDTVIFWYRPNPISACSTGNTTVNTASQLQIEFDPKDVLKNRINVMALLSDANYGVQVTTGSDLVDVEWDFSPDSEIGPGIYFGSVPFYSGEVEVTLYEDDFAIASAKGLKISSSCDGDVANYNAWVGSLTGTYDTDASTLIPLSNQTCIQGKGAYDFDQLCNFTCKYGYCPDGACTCEAMGVPRTKPNATGVTGYPAEGKDANYEGLCSFSCNYGYCPTKTCDTTEHAMPVPTVSDFLPPACIAGTGDGNNAGLCSYACNYGYCPIQFCTCTETGALVTSPAQTNGTGEAADGVDSSLDDLCDFTCSRGYCPSAACKYTVITTTTTPVSVIWSTEEGKTCSTAQKSLALTELAYAVDVATATAADLQSGIYYETFFASSVRNEANFASDTAETFTRIAKMLAGSASDYQVTYSCNDNTKFCEMSNYKAHMSDRKRTLNFCTAFFAANPSTNDIMSTQSRLSDCDSINLRQAHRSRAVVLLHEMTHTSYAMLGKTK
ncbi:mutanase [Penicillium taxi]|uniref:mutanase n=1 Tax=Penicillium taxi TaxID=168475 RepID=UPI002544F15A|nr:mutanase [Penicillium taxi]KAJ5884631.1 mutanase [Penicillium taxi]